MYRLNLSPFPHSLSISSFSLHFLAALLPGCHKLCNPALHTTNELLWNQEVCCAQQNSIGFRSLYWLLFLSIALSLGHLGRGQCRTEIYMKNTCNAYIWKIPAKKLTATGHILISSSKNVSL